MGLRFALVFLAILALIGSYKVKIDTKILRICVAMFIVLFGTSQIVFGLIESDSIDPTYCVMLVLMASMSSSLFRLPFIESVIVNFSLWVIFIILTPAFYAYDTFDNFISAAGRF